MRIQSPFLRIIFTAVGAVVLVAGGLLFCRQVQSSAESRATSIGIQPDAATADRLALKRITADVLRYPNGRDYIVDSNNSIWATFNDLERRSVIYDRKVQRLTFVSQGAGKGWDGVTLPMLERALNAPDCFRAFQQYGCKSWP